MYLSFRYLNYSDVNYHLLGFLNFIVNFRFIITIDYPGLSLGQSNQAIYFSFQYKTQKVSKIYAISF